MSKIPRPPLPPTSSALVPASPQGLGRQPRGENPFRHYMNLLSADTSKTTMRSALKVVAQIVARGPADPATFPWQGLQPANTAQIYAALFKRFRRPHKYLAALRGVLRSCWLLGLISQETFAKLTYFPRRRGAGSAVLAPAGRMLAPEEVQALFNATRVAGSALGLRDGVLLTLAYSGGMRREEIADLNTSALEADGVLRFTGKLKKVRLVPLPPRALMLVRHWISLVGPGPMLRRLQADGRLGKKGISKAGVSHALKELQARSPGCAPFTPHDLRRTFASTLIELTGDINSVQRLMGHESPTTTLGYDRRGAKAMKRLTALIDVPQERQ